MVEATRPTFYFLHSLSSGKEGSWRMLEKWESREKIEVVSFSIFCGIIGLYGVAWWYSFSFHCPTLFYFYALLLSSISHHIQRLKADIVLSCLQIEYIESNEPNDEARAVYMLKLWVEAEGDEANQESLIYTLEGLKMAQVANGVFSWVNSSPKSVSSLLGLQSVHQRTVFELHFM